MSNICVHTGACGMLRALHRRQLHAHTRVLPGGKLFRGGGGNIACAQQFVDIVCLTQPKFKRLLPHLVDTTHCEYNAAHNLALSLASVNPPGVNNPEHLHSQVGTPHNLVHLCHHPGKSAKQRDRMVGVEAALGTLGGACQPSTITRIPLAPCSRHHESIALRPTDMPDQGQGIRLCWSPLADVLSCVVAQTILVRT